MTCSVYQSLLVKDMSDADKVDLFISNLKQYLRGPVRLHMLDKAKDKLDLAMQVASEINYELKKDRRVSDSRAPAPTSSKLSSAQSPSPAVRKCYKCGSTEHLRAQCPQVRKGRGGGQRHGNKAQARAASAQASENA